MDAESARARSMNETRDRILEVALDVLGQNRDAGMGEIASAAGVVRRTVYGHFPTRTDLVRSLTERAVGEIDGVLTEVDAPGREPDAVWVDFIGRLWPLAHRYQALLALRRGEHGTEIHALLAPVDAALADLVQRGQDLQVFGRHLPAAMLSQLAFSAVFSIADSEAALGASGARAAAVTSLLLLGVPETRAQSLASE